MSKENIYQQNEIIEIEWDDTATVQNWHSIKSKFLTENGGLTRTKSVGYFLRQTDKSIQISQAFCSDTGGRCNSQCIHLGTITKIRKFSKPQESK